METAIIQERSLAFEKLLSEAKVLFEGTLSEKLNLTRVNAPLFVKKESGLNDDLNGIERAVSFDLNGEKHEVVHSLAKWKRWYLGALNAKVGEGIVTDMRAIRADEHLSPIHSNLVDQWDWERVISPEERTIDTLITHGIAVYASLKKVEREVSQITINRPTLPDTLKVIHTEELLQMYPEMTAKEREHAITARFGAVLLIGIGGSLSNGEIHDLRAPDYDDWSTANIDGYKGLNADLLVWDSIRGSSLEISSMGIRVNKEALVKQLDLLGVEERLQLPFHKALVNGRLPQTIGGGIGQSRLAMFVAQRANISEVQAIII